jgi:TM2 domain-containing membrane protein YozV
MTKDVDSSPPLSHSVVVGYVAWLFGIFGAHRFYYGRRWTGLLWLCTGGLLLVGWIVDLFLIPGMNADADRRYAKGTIDYTVAWLLFAFLGILGVHRFYMGKVGTGVLWLCTGGLLTLGVIYDLFTLNDQVSEINASRR